DRIARNEKNSHRNDGSTFGNREGRLPKKPFGYYTEYVHPTKGIDGPGPQRVVVGKDGDVWYTPNHYESFKKVK
ncbi:MAG: ribonuclease, partial [Planctomycetes bacterium]|nr:ribonuclease [Planctomycetota bacterium]